MSAHGFSKRTWIRRPKYVCMIGLGGVEECRRLAGFKKMQIASDIMPLDFLRTVGTHDIPAESGLYFLWRGPQLLYIGQTYSLRERIEVHGMNRDGIRFSKKRIPFTHCTFVFCADDKRLREKLEQQYIRVYLPPYNDKVN